MKLEAKYALFEWRRHDNASIEVILMPFLYKGELVTTSIRLDGIAGLPMDLKKVTGKAFLYPINPLDGYMDGSMYVQGRHWPVDISRLAFGSVGSHFVSTSMSGTVRDESSSDSEAFPLNLDARVELNLPEEEIRRRVGTAIEELGARTSKDVGRVVAAVKHRLIYHSDVAKAAVIAASLLSKGA